MRMVMLSIYESICHGKNSIIGRLASAGVHKPQKYIAFYGLRNWAKFGEKFITEQVYIHAKMMIVDDRVVIIGSGIYCPFICSGLFYFSSSLYQLWVCKTLF